MARARNIKPSFFLNEHLAELDPLARLLFIGLWCIADREGRLEDRPKRIKAEVLPYDSCNVEKLLEDLASGPDPFITRYEVGGNKYILINNFKKHQNPHQNEKASVIPAPEGIEKFQEITGAVQEMHHTNRAESLKLNPDSGFLDPDLQEDDDWTKIASVYTELTGRPESPLDVQDMKDVLKLAEADQIIQMMRDINTRFRPKYDGDKIKSFSYFRAAIEGELKGGHSDGENRRDPPKSDAAKRFYSKTLDDV